MIPACKTMKHQNDSLMFYIWLVNALTYYAYTLTSGKTLHSVKRELKFQLRTLEQHWKKGEMGGCTKYTYTSIWGQTTDHMEPF